MKIRIAFLAPEQQSGIGGGDRKYDLYYNNLQDEYFWAVYLCVTHTLAHEDLEAERPVVFHDHVLGYLQQHQIEYVYLAWAKISPEMEKSITDYCPMLINVNFTPCYRPTGNYLNLVISKTDYVKLQLMHWILHNAWVVYNPINVSNWLRLAQTAVATHRSNTAFTQKEFIVGRIARAEPSKWHFLMLSSLRLLDHKNDYRYGFLFAGCPVLYRKAMKVLLSKKMYNSIVFIPELRRLEDIAEFYASIDLFWQTSWIGESFGNVIAEANCFWVPVMTDYKAFFRNGKVNPVIYDAQIELVDHQITWAYCARPDAVVTFLQAQTKETLQLLGKAGREKTIREYNVVDTAATLAKVLYAYGKENGVYNEDQLFEGIVQKPTPQEVVDYMAEYHRRLEICKHTSKLSFWGYNMYKLLNNIWRWLEWWYLLYRKMSKKYLHRDIEKF